MNRFVGFFFIIVFSAFSVVAAEGPRMLTWDDLVPKLKTLDNPFSNLSDDQIYDVRALLAVGEMKKRGSFSEVSEVAEQAVESRHRLKKQGLNPDSLLLAYERLQNEIERRNQMTVRALDGKLVRIPGYALPLEHAGTGVTEMLLVPYTGACIHVPPPPANQALYVKLDQSYKADDLFEPVWITGRVKIRATSKSLEYVDGSGDVATAYTVENVIVTPYAD